MVPENLVDNQEAKLTAIHFSKFKFHLLTYENEIYIAVNEGLKLIGVDINWLCTARAYNRYRTLKAQGFSFKEKLFCCQIENTDKFLFINAYPYKDWLRLWSYFGKRGNIKAIAILKGLAQYGLEAYL
jgi:hypothetical protein